MQPIERHVLPDMALFFPHEEPNELGVRKYFM